MDIEKIVQKVYDIAEEDVGHEPYSLIATGCTELEAVRAISRMRKAKVFKAVTYERDEDDNILIKVTYYNKKNMHFEKKKRRK